MRANAPEWEPGRRDTLQTLASDFVPPFPASGRRNVGALPRNVSSCQTEVGTMPALAFWRANDEDDRAGLIAALAQRQSRGLIEQKVALKGNFQMRTG
jgi:hypothetical protein